MKIGKRYWWFINNYENKIKSGLFTGEYSKNGNPLLLTKNGECWSIPKKDLLERKPSNNENYKAWKKA